MPRIRGTKPSWTRFAHSPAEPRRTWYFLTAINIGWSPVQGGAAQQAKCCPYQEYSRLSATEWRLHRSLRYRSSLMSQVAPLRQTEYFIAQAKYVIEFPRAVRIRPFTIRGATLTTEMSP